ncbi:two-component system response regulator [Cupriavidus basilensis]|uniref:Two-component system response regulator n=1 Tax=Cupriavidus basilensis TaxID=68895 RepID=A0ABT6AT04_9BURK|nr:two-component system response regulator [Cupriavidus basilensis]MDF3835760.1 two-component system response regulator [Cupriavidus basilensis]
MRPENLDAQPTILVVDDLPENLAMMAALLQDRYRVKVATSGGDAVRIASAAPPGLILLDVMMPGIDGYEVCRRLKSDPVTMDVPVIFLTSRTGEHDETRGFQVGAVDYIMKPISPLVMHARIATHLTLKNARDFLRDKSAYLEQEVQRRTREISMIQDVTIMAMASLAETRDNETGNHLRRTQHYVRRLAQSLRHHPRFSGILDDATIDLLFKSAPLHDIGKVGIPDRILLKPGKLTPEEFEVMKTHTTLGRDAIAHAEAQCGAPNSFLRFAREIAHYHQEKWDGSGYPEGLAGDAIPVSARLMAIADVYDALISRRVYKPPFPHAQAVRMIEQGSGSHFDPDMVDAFLAIADAFQSISLRYADTDADYAREAALLATNGYAAASAG